MKTVYIIIAFCAGLFLGHLLFPSEQNIKPPSLVEVQKTQAKLNVIDSGLFAEKVHFLKENDSLKEKLQVANNLLSIHKSLLHNERSKVVQLVSEIKHDTIFQRDSVLTDSLSSELADLNRNTDSLINNYEQKDSLMQKMVAIRDSQIMVCDESYRESKDLILEQEKREQQLTENLNTTLKQLKRNRFQNKILAAGMLFVSGIAATLYIKSKP
jgi:hypothetical protein